MFSFFKKDPLHEELKQAKKVRKAKDKLFWKENARRHKEDKRINTFLHNDICPKCSEPIKLKQSTNNSTGSTDNYYYCTKCKFQTHIYGNDDDE